MVEIFNRPLTIVKRWLKFSTMAKLLASVKTLVGRSGLKNFKTGAKVTKKIKIEIDSSCYKPHCHFTLLDNKRVSGSAIAANSGIKSWNQIRYVCAK